MNKNVIIGNEPFNGLNVYECRTTDVPTEQILDDLKNCDSIDDVINKIDEIESVLAKSRPHILFQMSGKNEHYGRTQFLAVPLFTHREHFGEITFDENEIGKMINESHTVAIVTDRTSLARTNRLQTTLDYAIDICYNKDTNKKMTISKIAYQSIGNKVIDYINGGIQMNFDEHNMPTTLTNLEEQNQEMQDRTKNLQIQNQEMQDRTKNLQMQNKEIQKQNTELNSKIDKLEELVNSLIESNSLNQKQTNRSRM